MNSLDSARVDILHTSPVLGTDMSIYGDEFDGRMSALGAEGTGFNSRVPDKIF